MNVDEIRKWHRVFKRDDELFEIRILGERVYSGYFYDVEEAIRQLEPFDNSNIYYSVNEIKTACASRSQFNRFVQVKGTATSKLDVEHRWWLPIDLDCERPSGVSSTDEEKSFAYKKAQEVFLFLRKNGIAEPVVCDSSSGYHLMIPIDMENTAESETAVKIFLETLGSHFSDEHVKIDCVLFDANRIIRLSGSYGRKGRNSEERPHRLAHIKFVPTIEHRVTIEEINAFNDKYKVVVEQPQRRNTYNGQSNGEEFDLRKFIAEHGINVAKEVSISGGGTKYILQECPFDSGHKAPDSSLFELPNGAIAFKCLHNSCSMHDWRAFRLHFDPTAYDHENRQPQYRPTSFQQQLPQFQPKPKYQIKEENPELGKKWFCLNDIEKVDITKIHTIKTGFKEIDNAIVGLNDAEVSILSGSNSAGKSSWLNTLMLNVIDQGEKVALWSGELPPYILKSWIQMVAAGRRNLMPSKIADGKYYVPANIAEKIDDWLAGKLFIYNNEYSAKWEQIFNDMNELISLGVKLFVLDNLFSLDINDLVGDKNNKQKELILQICQFAKKNKVHIFLVAHPRKGTAFLRKTDISGTADLTNAVDNVFIAHRVNNDFQKAGAEFLGAAVIQQYMGFGNCIEIAKNRMYGIVDKMCGMYYDVPSRRFMNEADEDVKYGWERGSIQQPIQMPQVTPTPQVPPQVVAPEPTTSSAPTFADMQNDYLYGDNNGAQEEYPF